MIATWGVSLHLAKITLIDYDDEAGDDLDEDQCRLGGVAYPMWDADMYEIVGSDGDMRNSQVVNFFSNYFYGDCILTTI